LVNSDQSSLGQVAEQRCPGVACDQAIQAAGFRSNRDGDFTAAPCAGRCRFRVGGFRLAPGHENRGHGDEGRQVPQLSGQKLTERPTNCPIEILCNSAAQS